MDIDATLTSHLQNVVRVLTEANLRYALAGGLAYSTLVVPRATMDIDVLILLEDASIQQVFERLVFYFDEFHPQHYPVKFALMQIWRTVGIVRQQQVILDFLLAESDFHRSALNRALTIDFRGTPLHIVTLEDLLLLKRCAHRPHDEADIQTIYHLFEQELDQVYITRWQQRLKLTSPSDGHHD